VRESHGINNQQKRDKGKHNVGFKIMGSNTDMIAKLHLEAVALQRRFDNLAAQDIAAYSKAFTEVSALSKKCLMGSGLILEIRHLSGAVALSPICISDGLGAGTLECLAQDIRASHETRIAINPARFFKL